MATRRPRTGLAGEQISVEAFLADSVVGPGDGKLYVQGGGWNLVNTSVLPIRQPRIGIAAFIRVPYVLADGQRHRLELRLDDADGRPQGIGTPPPGTETPDGQLHQITADFAVGRPVGIEPGDEQILGLAINLDGVVFERAGVYTFVIAIDGAEAKRLRFKINLMTQATLTAG